MPEGFRIATAYVAVEASDEGFRQQLDAKIKAASEGVAAKVKVEADAAGLAEKVRAEADAAATDVHVHVKVDDDGGSLTSLQGDAQRLRSSFDDLEGSARRAGASIDEAGSRSSSAGSRAGGASGGFRLASVGMGTMAAAGVTLVPVLAAIPGLAAGAAAGVGVLAGAFLGVAKALHDYGAQQDAVGGGGAGGQTAATAYSNAVAIRGAEQAVADAREQSARSAQRSSEQVKAAQQGVVDAERSAATATQSAADQIVAAQQRVTQAAYAGQQAKQAYTNAVYNETQAEHALVDAKLAAADQLVDSQNAAKDAHLSTEKAAADAAAAQKALTDARKAGATADQLATLDLAARSAAQQLADAKQREKEAVEKATAATKAGVEQAPSVLSAQHAVQMAAQSTASAQHGVAQAAQQQSDAQAALAKAQKAAADQQVTSAEQVAKAQRSLADAERQADQQREDSAKAVQRAQQNLIDTVKEQQLASAAAASSGAAVANQFQKDYDKLTPAAKAFVDQVLSMRGELHQLGAEAQTATLPGFTQMLKDSQHLMPVFEDGVKRTGKALGDTAAAAGHLFANPQFDAAALQFEQLITGGFGEFVSALPPLLNAIVVDGDRAAPLINAVAVGIHDVIATGLPDFLSGLTVNAGGAAQGVGALFRAVDALLGPVGTLAGAAAGALGPALADVEPTIARLATDVEQDLLPLMPQLSTDLVDVAHVVDELFQVLEPIIPLLADELGTALRIIDPLLKDTAGFLHDNANWLTPVAEGILGVVAAIKIYNGVSGIITSATGKATTALGKFSSSAKTAATDAERAAESVGGARGLAGKIGGAIPVVGGLVAAGVALGSWLSTVAEGGHKAAMSIDQYTTAMMGAQGASALLSGDSGKLDAGLEKLGVHATGSTAKIVGLGIAMGEMSQKGIDGGDAMKNYDGALAGLVASGHADRAKQIVDQIAAATDNHGKKIINTVRDFPEYFAALDHQAAEQATATTSTDHATSALGDLGSQLGTTTDKFQTLSDTMSRSEALDRFHAQLLNLSQAAQDNGTSLDSNTAKGLANRQAFSDLADQIAAYGKRLHDAGDADGVVGARMQDMIGDLETQGEKYGFNKQQIDKYIKSLGLIPSSVTTTLNQKIAYDINQEALKAALDNIDHIVGGHHLIPGNAAGGLVTGPGTGTSDSILRRVSNGEFIVPADATAKLGLAAMESIRNGRIPQVGGTTPQAAAAPTINLNYYGTQQPTPEQKQIMMRDLALAVRG
ncbi:MAG: hypothetical protein YHS30scaffold324_64 [Catenulispora phage 69_17]|nr:MAG: hypothetical protein YHS30scaffold324_64 [Catenulispora phage 69_17]